MSATAFQISFKRTGGVAGVRQCVDIRSERLDPAEADRICRMIERSGYFSLRSSYPRPASAADLLEFTITVSLGRKKHSVHASELTAPAALQPLLDWLAERAEA